MNIYRLIVYEFMPRRSLENHIFKGYSGTLPWLTRIKIAIGSSVFEPQPQISTHNE
ncbi:hypothetical protein CsatA_005338 [Cannabis sativa]